MAASRRRNARWVAMAWAASCAGAALLAGCRGAGASSRDGAASAPAGAPSVTDAAGGSAVAPSASAAATAVRELKAAARTRLAADRAAVANRVSFEQALERLARDARMTRMYERIPAGAIDAEAVRDALVRYARGQGLSLAPADVTSGSSPPGQAVPLEHRGASPYPYTESQLLEAVPITVRLRGADEAAVTRFYRLLPGGVGILVDLTTRWREGADTVLSGAVYRWRDVTPPRHLLEPPTLESLAREAHVDVPTGAPGVEEVQGLLDRWASLRPALERVLEVAGRAHLAGARADLYQQKTRAIEARSVPPEGPPRPARPPIPPSPVPRRPGGSP